MKYIRKRENRRKHESWLAWLAKASARLQPGGMEHQRREEENILEEMRSGG